jgi:Domain of unknown function (DUF4412)
MNMKTTVMMLGLLALVPATASADLKYTIHMSVKKVEVPAAQPANPMVAMMGEMMMKQLLPPGGADIVYTIGDKGSRVEYLQAAMGQAEGSVMLSHADGSITVLNPKEQTYWNMAAPTVPAMMKGDATVKATGQFETVAGVKCEVVAFDYKMDLPIPESARASMPPDFPMSLAMAGDTCVVKDQFQHYAALSAKGNIGGMMAAMGLDKLTQGGIVLRQTMRMAGMEMTSIATKVGEEDVPASAFEVPAGFKEVPAPAGMGMR